MSIEKRKIGTLGRIVTGKTPPTKQREYFDGEFPFITPTDLDFFQYHCPMTAATVTEEAKSKFKNQFLPAGAVMFTCIGNTIGKSAIAVETCLTNQQINSIIPSENNDSKYVYYLLCNNIPVFKAQGGGVATPIVNKSQFEAIELPVHKFAQQTKIGSILSAYDDLIENNLRRIELLENAARMIYKEWFVDLNYPGREHMKIVDGVPEGWARGPISDFYNTSSGGTPSRKNPEFFTGDIRWVKTQELQNGFIIDTDEKINEEALHKSSAKLFPARSVLVAMYGATIGQLGILAHESTTNQACCAIIPKEQRTGYVLSFLHLRENKVNLVNLSQGAAQNNINQQTVRNFEILMPSKSILATFNELVEPQFELILKLQMQIAALKKAREMLLPKLMSGDIAV